MYDFCHPEISIKNNSTFALNCLTFYPDDFLPLKKVFFLNTQSCSLHPVHIDTCTLWFLIFVFCDIPFTLIQAALSGFLYLCFATTNNLHTQFIQIFERKNKPFYLQNLHAISFFIPRLFQIHIFILYRWCMTLPK